MKSAGSLPTGRRFLWWRQYRYVVVEARDTVRRGTFWAASVKRSRRTLGSIVGGAR